MASKKPGFSGAPERMAVDEEAGLEMPGGTARRYAPASTITLPASTPPSASIRYVTSASTVLRRPSGHSRKNAVPRARRPSPGCAPRAGGFSGSVPESSTVPPFMLPLASATSRSLSSVRRPDTLEMATLGFGSPSATFASVAPPENASAPNSPAARASIAAVPEIPSGTNVLASERSTSPASRTSIRGRAPRTSPPPLSVSVRVPTTHAASCTWTLPLSMRIRAGFGCRIVRPDSFVSDCVMTAVPRSLSMAGADASRSSVASTCPLSCSTRSRPIHGSRAACVRPVIVARRLEEAGRSPGPVRNDIGAWPCAAIAAPAHVPRASSRWIASPARRTRTLIPVTGG